MAQRAEHAVVVTGVGPIAANGRGREDFWRAALAGRTGTRRLTFDWSSSPPFKCLVGAPVEPPAPAEALLTAAEARLLDPVTILALAAARMALEDAGFRPELVDEKKNRYALPGIDPERAGTVIGTGIGGISSVESSHTQWLEERAIKGRLRYAVPMLIPNAPAGQVAIKFGLRGECKAVTTACAAGTMAIGDAFRLVRHGELDLVVTGGVEKALGDVDGFSLIGFDVLRTVSRRNDDPEHASRPFDRDRDGFVMADGAGILVLEREEHARARGARILARVTGYAATCDAHSMMALAPDGEQITRVMRRALEDADRAPSDVVYVNAHGTATRLNDPSEARAIRRALGSAADDIRVSSTKAMTGHAIGGSGGLEAIVTALSLAEGVVHRCVNLENVDPECDLVPLPRENARIEPGVALSNSFGFGGHNACLALETP